MKRSIAVLLILLAGAVGNNGATAADAGVDLRDLLAKEFYGTYKFYYLFSENGVPYVDVPGHLQLLELDRHDGATRVSSSIRAARAQSTRTIATCFT